MAIDPEVEETIRLLIASPGATEIFTGDQLERFLTLEGGHVKLAAAQALSSIAVNEALVSKVITDGQLKTDGAKLATELRALAKELRAQHAASVAEDDEGYFAIVGGGAPCRPELTEYPRSW